MTSEFLLDAIGQLDDDLVLEAAAPVKRVIPWTRVAGLAAALVLCVGLTRLPGLLPKYGSSTGAAESAPTSHDPFHNYTKDEELSAGSAAADSATGDMKQEAAPSRFFTAKGLYRVLDGHNEPLPPEGAMALGRLNFSADGKTFPATDDGTLVGCPVWESADGAYLYIKLPEGGWITAALWKK